MKHIVSILLGASIILVSFGMIHTNNRITRTNKHINALYENINGLIQLDSLQTINLKGLTQNDSIITQNIQLMLERVNNQ